MPLVVQTRVVKILARSTDMLASLQTKIDFTCCFSSDPVLAGYSHRYARSLLYMSCQVPVQPSEWHRTLLLPQAWLSFMNRAYNACVEVRSLRTTEVKAKTLPLPIYLDCSP